MSDLLPWIALVLGLALGAAAIGWSEERRIPGLGPLGLVLAVALIVPWVGFSALTASKPEVGEVLAFMPYVSGAVLGAAGLLFFRSVRSDRWMAEVGCLGLAAAGLLLMRGQDGATSASSAWSFMIGVAGVSMAGAALGHGQGAAGLVAGAVAACTAGSLAVFKKLADPFAGPAALALAAMIAAIIVAGAASMLKEKRVWAGPIGVALFSLGGGFAVQQIAGQSELLAICCVVGVVSLAMAWAVPAEGSRGLWLPVCALVWLGAATYALSQLQGYGMALAGLAAVACFLLLGRSDLLGALGPFLVLVIYRLFREGYGDLARSFDIGQHYAILGVLSATILGMAAHEAAKVVSDRSSWSGAAKTAALGLCFGILTLTAGMVLGGKGAVGLLIGFAFVPVAGMLAGERGDLKLITSLAGAALVAGSYKALAPLTDLAKSEKQMWMLGAAVVAAILAAAAIYSNRSMGEQRDA